MSKKQEKWTIFGEVIRILWIFSPRRNSIASPWSPCSGTTSSSSMSTRKSSSPTSTPFPGSEITDSAVDLRRSWSYYAIFVFFLWYCPGLLILCATDTSNDSGGKERLTRDNRSELSQTRSQSSTKVRSLGPNCHAIAESLASLSSALRLEAAKPNLALADK